MPKPLDRQTYKLVEWRLHREALMRQTVRDYEQDILLASTRTDYSQPVVKHIGIPGDPVSWKAFKLTEGTPQVRQAQLWIRVIDHTRKWFADTTEGKLFTLFYGKTTGIDQVAAAMGTDRRRVERLRDNIVYRAAMYALEERLYRLASSKNHQGGDEA